MNTSCRFGTMYSMKLTFKNTFSVGLTSLLLTATASVHAMCWEQASAEYGIPIDVLKAIAKTESGFNNDAKKTNRDGSTDIGMMQIHSNWLPTLKKYEITRNDLATDPCLNLRVGAWVLSNNVQKLGWSWDAIGAYNVGCKSLTKDECQSRRSAYALKVHNAMKYVGQLGSQMPQAARLSRTGLNAKPLQVASPKIIVISMNSVAEPTSETSIADQPGAEVEPTGFYFYQTSESQ